MSASISWSPVSPQSLCAGCSSVARKLQDVFGTAPFTLTMEAHMDKLLVMIKMHEGSDNPYQELADALLEHGEIVVEVSW